MKAKEAASLIERLRSLPPKKRRFLEKRLAERGIEVGELGILPRLGPRAVFPMSHTQERLWFLYQLDPESTAYHIWSFHELWGEFDRSALERAFAEMVRRHEILRTTFENRDGELIQYVHRRRVLSLPTIDLQNLPPGEREAEARRIRISQREQPFDLERGPLLRLYHLALDREDNVLVLTIHHILSDAWSIGVFHRELHTLYYAFAAGCRSIEESPLDPLPIQYGDFVHWQRTYQQPKTEAEQLAYWRRQLEDAPALLELPTDRPRPTFQSSRGASVKLTLPAEIVERLRTFCRQQKATLFMALLASYQALLMRYSGQEDVSVGSPIAARNREELEQLIGFFANTLVLRSDLRGNPSFRELLSRVRRVVLDAQQNQDLSFARLVNELEPERSLSHAPLFQASFAIINTPEYDGTKSWNRLDLPRNSALFDLHLELLERSSGAVTGWLYYSTDLFDATTAWRLCNHCIALSWRAVLRPDDGLWDLPLLMPGERHQLVSEWNDTATEFSAEPCLDQVLATQARRTPEAIAVEFEDQQLSYRALDAAAERLASTLRDSGVAPEVPVGIAMERSLEMVVGLVGILKAGGAYVPLDPSYPPKRLAFMLADAALPVLLTTEALAARVRAMVSDADADTAVHVLASGRPPDGVRAAASPASRAAPENLAYVIYTSGSTGRPKGAMNRHRAIVNRLLWMQEAYRLTGEDRVLQKTPISFDVSVWEFFWPLLSGARLVMARPGGHRDAGYLVRLIAARKITTLHFVPPMLGAFLAEDGLERCRSLRRVIASGEALPAELVTRHFARLDADLHNLYGPTEAAVDVTYHPCARGLAERSIPIGRPIANLQIRLLDRRLNPVPIGVPGELYIGGVGLARGYLGRPRLTGETFLPDPLAHPARPPTPGSRLYRTGDLARYRTDGAIEFLGRRDHQVKVRGFRIELGEIERALLEHPGVREAVVLARRQASGHRRLVAYFVERPGNRVPAEALTEFLRDRLPEHMVPPVFTLLAELPLLPNGKIDRAALPAPDGSDRGQDFVPPREPAEEILAAVWAEVLRLERVGVHDNFFRLGGDSILALQVVSKANRKGLHLIPRQLFQHPTVAELAAAGATRELRAQQTSVSGPVPLTPIQRWFFEHHRQDPDHWNQAVLLAVRDRLEPALLSSAIGLLLRHHDALRMRFSSSEDGDWRQENLPGIDKTPFLHVDLGALPESARRAALETAAAQVQASLDLDAGTVFRTVFFAPPRRLLAVAHHLVIDGVSWRILLEDLESAYRQLAEGRAVTLPAKTTSFKDWAERLTSWARDGRFADELPYWSAGATAGRAPPLPVDADGENLVATARVVTSSLGAADTERLLRDAPAAYRMRIDEVLLAAFALAVSDWTVAGTVRVDLESHGRDAGEETDLFDRVDVGRTVGWFTALYPVVLELPEDAEPGEILKSVKEQLRRIPNRGIGYGVLRFLSSDAETRERLRNLSRGEISFNYLGRLDLALPETTGFSGAPESPGPSRSPEGRRPYLLEVDASVAGGRLRLAWTYSRYRHHQRTIESLARRYVESLETLIAHCCSPQAGGLTPSDFPLARLSQQALDVLLAEQPEIDDLYPLTPVQQGIFLHALAAPEHGLYFQQLVTSLGGRLDVDRFRAACGHVLARHAILRSAFHRRLLVEPLQSVARDVVLPVVEEDWRDLPQPAQAERLETFLKTDREQGFELSRPPLMRLKVIRTGAEAWRIVWSYHHLLLDGWSLPLLLTEVFTAYATLGTEAEPPTTRPSRFRDYVAWLRRQDREAAERFWRRELEGFTAPTPLRADRPEAEPGDFAEEFRLLASAQEEIAEVARRRGLTLNTLVQGAWALVLARLSDERDVAFGTVLSGRSAPIDGIESMIGMFINTLPVRVRMPADASAADWLDELQRRQAELRQYEWSSLVEVKGWSSVPHDRPLFESLLIFENYPLPSDAGKEGSLRFDDIRTIERTHYPLTVVAVPGTALSLSIGYDRRRFDTVTIRRWLRHLETALRRLAAEPERRLADLDLWHDAERHQVLHEWNDFARRYERGLEPSGNDTLIRLFEQTAARVPERLALVLDGEGLSYGELDRRADRLARRLRARGVAPEVVVAIAMERSFEMVIAILAVLKAGGAYLPLDPQTPAARLVAVLRDSGAAGVLTRGRGLEPSAGQPVPELAITAGGEASAWPEGELGGRQAGGRETRQAEDANLAYVIYTSGSTGRPKGVAVTHRGVVNTLLWRLSTFALDEDDVILQNIACTFDPSVWQIFGALLSGGRLVLVKPGDERDFPGFVRVLLAERVTITDLAPSMLALFLDQRRVAECRSLRLLFAGAEALPVALQDRFLATFDADLRNIYGPTEASIDAACWRCRPGAALDRVPIGRPVANKRLLISGADLDLRPIGLEGELYIGGEGLARGYVGRPSLTAERFLPDPWSARPGERLYRTGDRVRSRADGALEFLGRSDRQVKVRGFRVELGEVEAALVRHPGIREAAVVARADAMDRGGRLVGYFVATERSPAGAGEPALSERAVRDFVAERLPLYMVPDVLLPLDALPRTPGGKVDYRALPELGPAAPQRPYLAPRTELERVVAGIWQEVLGAERVGIDDNFFDLGGHSLLLMRVHGLLQEALERDLPVVVLFNYPTIRALARHLDPTVEEDPVVSRARRDAGRQVAARGDAERASEGVAILAMVGRFPGARTVDELWRNLCDGREGISFFSPEALRDAGVPAATLERPDYVRARGRLTDVDLFDAEFFDLRAREAEVLDPQQRLFLEASWQALEEAGYDPGRYDGSIGVYAGVGANAYLFNNLLANPGYLASVGLEQVTLGSDKDFLATRVSYKLDLTGPSLTVQTACSTSLVAVHLAVQALLSRQCDMALAGGCAISVPEERGYLHREGGIFSPDGHCRAFDAEARGTVAGNGLGVVVLKRLERALADGDPIRAVIRGTAVNNDGSFKVGYTAPSVDGQAAVIASAQTVAGVRPEEIGYVEAHGTGTPLGDPIEFAALGKVFGQRPAGGRCALGSIKSNLGHLDAAAGVAGLIKTALVVERGRIPPSLHFEKPNPELDYDRSAFSVSAELHDWQPADGSPRRAGVSSFGIGGTNAHAVVEQAPRRRRSSPAGRWQLLVLSARSESALEQATDRLARHFGGQQTAADPARLFADQAYTLLAGRRVFEHRRVAVCRDAADAAAVLSSRDPRRLLTAARASRELDEPRVAFLFPGQGAQYAGMARELYRSQPLFRETVERAAETFEPRLGVDLRQVFDPPARTEDDVERALAQTALTQSALFTLELALARLLVSWGVRPAACLGHSIGEYVAACLAGVFTFEEALDVVAIRGELMQALPAGSMLSVRLSAAAVETRLSPELAIAAVNGPENVVVSGPDEAVAAFARELEREKIACRPLRTSHAFHSPMMTPIVETFAARVAEILRSRPRPATLEVPFVSNLTGAWITAAEAGDPDYWARHLRHTVRFAAGLETLTAEPGMVLLEVGPGRSLSALARRAAGPGQGEAVRIVETLPAAADRSDEAALLTAVGRLWLADVPVSPAGLYAGQRRHRVALPTYPFERRRFWVEPAAAGTPVRRQAGRAEDPGDWLYVPVWRESVPPVGAEESARDWLIFLDARGIGEALARRLRERGHRVRTVAAGEGYETLGDDGFAIHPGRHRDYERLVAALAARDAPPSRIVHLWATAATAETRPPLERLERELASGFYSLLFLAQALAAEHREGGSLALTVVSEGLHEITGDEVLAPRRATLLGPVRVFPLEHPWLRCRSVDVVVPPAGDWRRDRLLAQLVTELTSAVAEPVVAWRGNRRFVQTAERLRAAVPDDAAPLRAGATYLITGGLGGIGLELARGVAETVPARLVLLSRSGLPPRAEWESEADPERRRAIARVRELEALGAEVTVLAGDVGDPDRMAHVLAEARRQYGAIDGVIHAAGVAGGGLSVLKKPADAAAVLAPKVRGTLVLHDLLRDDELDFFVLCSSLAALFGGLGQVDYAAANAFLDAYAASCGRRGDAPLQAIDWDAWSEVGMAARAAARRGAAAPDGIGSREGFEVLRRVLAGRRPQTIVSTRDLAAVAADAASIVEAAPATGGAEIPRHQRPAGVSAAFVAPRNRTEQTVAEILQEVLGVDRVGIDDDFNELGGDSLLAVQVLARLRQRFAVELTLRDLFDAPTASGLAVAILEQQVRSAEPEAFDRILSDLDDLSEEEVQALLAEDELVRDGS